jgi:hypothetical protein
VSSDRDREKVRCLKILGEVFQYVLQDKRDPSRVSDLLKDIINESNESEEKKPLQLDEERAIIESLIRRTKNRQIEWFIDYGSQDGSYLICQISPGKRFKIFKSESFFSGSWRHISFSLICEDLDQQYKTEIPLVNNDRKFFFSIYQEVKENRERKEKLIGEFVNLLKD